MCSLNEMWKSRCAVLICFPSLAGPPDCFVSTSSCRFEIQKLQIITEGQSECLAYIWEKTEHSCNLLPERVLESVLVV